MNSEHLQVRVNIYFKMGFLWNVGLNTYSFFSSLNDLTKEITQVNQTAQAY